MPSALGTVDGPENDSLPRLVRLLERERAPPVPKLKLLRPLEREPDEPVELELFDADDARRCRCMRVGSTSGRFARRAKSERTARAESAGCEGRMKVGAYHQRSRRFPLGCRCWWAGKLRVKARHRRLRRVDARML